MKRFQTDYGYFDDEAGEYIITRPDTPKPWVNVICPGDYGLVVSQTGGGYSWKTHASLNRITRWEQDLVRDDWGKYLYARDESTGEFWSLTWKPVCRRPEAYRVAHGMGYSVFTARNHGVESRLVLFVPPGEPVEVWHASLTNATDKPMTLSLFSYFEWCLGAAPDWHREFHKTFIETAFDAELGALFAQKRLWELGNAKGQHWNRSWEYLAFHSASGPVVGHEGEKEEFLGRYGSLSNPKAVEEGTLSGTTGKWTDAMASLQVRVELAPGETREVVYVLGAVGQQDRSTAEQLIRKYKDPAAARAALAETRRFWSGLLGTVQVRTPDEGFNLLTNQWLKYQAISGRLWGRTGYFQPGGAFGFRDQLQDSQVFLTVDPSRTKEQIRLHAEHQFSDGHVFHWWHPLAETGMENATSDNRLWLPFVTVAYLKETLDFAFLDERIRYRDAGEGSLYEHCLRAIDYNLQRLSPRGLPLIGGGDWNDGMNAVGTEGKGESIWLGHFLYGVLREFAGVAGRRGDAATQRRYDQQAEQLKAAVNRYGWDGEWYLRATCDDGTILGSSACREGRIYLNAQTWAVLNNVAGPERTAAVLAAVKKYLSREYGPLLLYPAYKTPDERIGYLTRYAPGVRENGGVYTHAAVWAIAAEAKAKDAAEAWRMYHNLCPVYRGMQPELYQVEPYVTPGNVDGPDSPHFGRGGWTWYTGSAAWLYRVSLEWLLGVRAEWEGLRVDPCIPAEWDGFTLTRPFRGAQYNIQVSNPRHVSHGVAKVVVDGQAVPPDAGPAFNVIPAFSDGRTHSVEVVLG